SMINSYNPSNQPNPQEWLALDEAERINLVLAYHNQAEDDMEGVYLHSTIHAVIEYQAALGDNYPVKATLDRLMKEELSRHDAIHAVGSVLIKYLWEVGTGENTSKDFSQDYFDEVSEFSAQKWFDEFS